MELSSKNRQSSIGAGLTTLVKTDETHRNEQSAALFIGKDGELVIGKHLKGRIDGKLSHDSRDNRAEQVDKKQSLTVGGNQQEKVGGKHALDAGQEIHLRAGTKVIAGAGADITLKAAGGHIRITSAGVEIKGNLVMINSGGAAGSGSGASPKAPDEPKEAKVPKPPKKLAEIQAKALEHKVLLPEVKDWPKVKKVPKVKLETKDHKKTDEPKSKQLHWIAIELVDEQGSPVSGERYEVILPDGKKRYGSTDSEGRARIEGIEQGGNCKVCFPRLDKEVWRKA